MQKLLRQTRPGPQHVGSPRRVRYFDPAFCVVAAAGREVPRSGPYARIATKSSAGLAYASNTSVPSCFCSFAQK
jgi:hypothetical protein